MMTSLKDIANGLKNKASPESIVIHEGENSIVAEVILGKRKQMVAITVQSNARLKYTLVKLRSRACPATSANIVKTALINNSGLGIGGFVLSTQDGVALIDIKHNLIANMHDFNELLFAISIVASTADSIESRILGHDVF